MGHGLWVMGYGSGKTGAVGPRPAILLLLLVLLVSLPLPVLAQPVPLPSPETTASPAASASPEGGGTRVDYKADKVEYLKEEGIYRLIGHVVLHVRDIEIKTEELEYDTNHRILRSKVPFEMIQTPKDPKDGGPRTLKGKSFAYNVSLRRIEAEAAYLVIPAQLPGQEVYIQGDWLTAYNDGERVVLRNGFFTTCNHFESQVPETAADFEDPYSRKAVKRRATHYAVEGEVMDYITNDRLLVWNAQVLTFENQAFWFPFWYVPLQGVAGFQRPDIDAGQNPVEGVFVRFKGYYKFNDYHDGYWFLSGMEKKGIGLGFQHDWIAFPNSITRLYFYGLPVTEDFIGLPGAIFSLPDPLKQAADQLQTQQDSSRNWLDVFSRYLSNKFQDHEFQLHHRQLLLPHMDADLTISDKDLYNISYFTSDRTPQRGFDLKLDDHESYALDPYSQLQLDTNLQLRQSNNGTLRLNTQADRLTQEKVTSNSQSQSRGAGITAQLGQSNLSFNSNWQNSFNQTNSEIISFASASPSPGASASPNQAQQNQQAPSVNESWNNNLTFRAPIDEKTNFNLRMVQESNTTSTAFTQTLRPHLDFAQSHDWGSMTLNYDDFFDLSPARNANTTGQLKKLPELDLNFSPFFKDSFPIQFQSTIGRYLEPASVIPGLSLNEISRTKLQLSLSPKDYDLGLGNKVNFSGTSFDQRFYQTLDAEYALNAGVSLRNDLSPYFIPQFNYRRSLTDPENHSPFQNLDSLRVSENNNLDVALRLVNLPEFNMTINGGYNYQEREYQPIRTNINSELGGRFALRFSTGYSPANIKDEHVGKPLQDLKRNDYRFADGTTRIVRTEDVGSFNPFGGRWDSTSLAMRWRSTDYDLNIGNLTNFGLDNGIPQGFELGSEITWDFDQGRLNGLNGLLRWTYGDNWLWHFEVDLVASVQPITIAGSSVDQILQGIEIPFNITVRKDLHDFILTLSWNSFNQQFNANLQLLAFPFSTSQLLGNVGSLNQQLNQLEGGIR